MRSAACCVAILIAVSCAGQQNTSQVRSPSPSPISSPTNSPSPTPSPPLASPTSATVRSGSFRLTRVAVGLKSPVYVTNARDGSGRLFIVEQAGRILVMEDGRVLPTPFLDIRSLVVSGGERGLLSVAFYPDFATNGAFVVDYTPPTCPVGDNVIARHKAGPGFHLADRSPGQ